MCETVTVRCPECTNGCYWCKFTGQHQLDPCDPIDQALLETLRADADPDAESDQRPDANKQDSVDVEDD